MARRLAEDAAPALAARLSSGTKMLFIMTAALMPLGLIALFASIQSAQGKRLQHEADARLIATAEARQIDLLVYKSANVLRFAAGALGNDPQQCPLLLDEAARVLRYRANIALFSATGRLRCATPGFAARRLPPSRGNIGIELLLLEPPGGLRYTVVSPGGTYAVGEIPLAVLRDALGAAAEGQAVMLRQGSAKLDLAQGLAPRTLGKQITVSAPIGGGQVTLSAVSVVSTITAVEVLLVLLPILMWAAAAVIGWAVVNGLLLRPLSQLQRAVARFGEGTEPFTPPRLQTPAREIEALGVAFAAAAEQIAQRGTALEEGLWRQVRLTREVHHRVKNNLQVVASLINLHARGTEGDVQAAYGSIQRRVDALAVVHRNHYAELEENRGVALRALVAELTANLRATAPPHAAGLSITLDMAPAHVTQDVAVPVAFLVTEIIELLMECGPTAPVSISLVEESELRAKLVIGSAALDKATCQEHPHRDRFDRITAGLARQLRAGLQRDKAAGTIAISLAVMPSPIASA